MSESVQPFGDSYPHTKKPLFFYTAQGKIDCAEYLGAVERDQIQDVENAVCRNILFGVTRKVEKYIYRPRLFRKPFKATPRLIRTKCTKRPVPEARSWVWFFLHHHPDIGMSKLAVAKRYRFAHSTVKAGIYGLTNDLLIASNKTLHGKIRLAAEELERHGYSAFDPCEAAGG